jgi:hypothetical protein
MGYQHVVLEDLRFVANAVRRLRPRCRFVVFVDDLDRCSDDRIMEVLQAIHLLLGDSDFFVFLGIDSEMIYRAIRRHYGGKEDAPPAARTVKGRTRATAARTLPELPQQDHPTLVLLPDTGDDQTAGYLSGCSASGQERVRELEGHANRRRPDADDGRRLPVRGRSVRRGCRSPGQVARRGGHRRRARRIPGPPRPWWRQPASSSA